MPHIPLGWLLTWFIQPMPLWAMAWAVLAAVPFPVPADATGLWWFTRPVWLLVPGTLLVAVLRDRRRAVLCGTERVDHRATPST